MIHRTNTVADNAREGLNSICELADRYGFVIVDDDRELVCGAAIALLHDEVAGDRNPINRLTRFAQGNEFNETIFHLPIRTKRQRPTR